MSFEIEDANCYSRSEMKLPGAERAVIEIEKLRDYCLHPTYPRGRHKASVFAAALGIERSDADWLRQKLLAAAVKNNARHGEVDQYGETVSA